MSEQFQSTCGCPFDSNPKSTCFTVCKTDDPESFSQCEQAFSAKAEEKKTKRKTAAKPKKTRKYDLIGDGVGTSASMINSLLICGATMQEMVDEIECGVSRIRGHFGGLRDGNKKRPPKEIFHSKENGRFYFDDPSLEYYGEMSEEGELPKPVAKGKKTSAKRKTTEKKSTKVKSKPKKPATKKASPKTKEA